MMIIFVGIKPTKMKILIFPFAAMLLTWSFSACKSTPPTFCDTACVTGPIIFQHTTEDSPYVMISLNNCEPDTITWSHRRLATKRKMGFEELVGKKARLNTNFVKCYFNDTSYAWLRFNDCITGRGFLVKLPYNKEDKWSIYTSALNDLDPKFDVEEGLIAYYDDTFLWVQELSTGKKDKMLMNDTPLEIDHNNVHETIDSIHVTRNKVWGNFKVGGDWKSKEKVISLQ